MFKIITGMHSGELKYPFDERVKNDFNLSKLYDYIYGKETYKTYARYCDEEYFSELKQKVKNMDEIIFECDSNTDSWEILEALNEKGVKEVEVMGSWATYCVGATILRALNYGMKVYVPDDKIFYSDDPTKYNHDLKWGVDFFNKNKYGFDFEDYKSIDYTYRFSEGMHIFERQYECKILNAPRILDGPPSNVVNKVVSYPVFNRFFDWLFKI